MIVLAQDIGKDSNRGIVFASSRILLAPRIIDPILIYHRPVTNLNSYFNEVANSYM